MVVALRMALDHLGVDRKRLAFVGHSYWRGSCWRLKTAFGESSRKRNIPKRELIWQEMLTPEEFSWRRSKPPPARLASSNPRAVPKLDHVITWTVTQVHVTRMVCPRNSYAEDHHFTSLWRPVSVDTRPRTRKSCDSVLRPKGNATSRAAFASLQCLAVHAPIHPIRILG